MPDFLNLKQQNIKYLDALTYLTIRSFHNSTTGKCYPAYETIAKRSGLGRTFTAESIKRLETAGFLKITHSARKHVCNQYHFGDLTRFERIPYEIFDADLSTNQKAMLICLRQFFNEGKFQSTKTITQFAALLGLSYNTVYVQYKALLSKDYFRERGILYDKSSSVRIILTGKIDWDYDYTTAKAKGENYNVKLRVA